MSLVVQTRRRCAELANFLEGVCEAPLDFTSEHPLDHSRFNHVHLWALEYWADRHGWIDLGYRVDFVEAILTRWTQRLRGYRPYQEQGYRLYLYADLAPTVSVVAETPHGCPYSGNLTFVERTVDVLRPYANRSWADNFTDDPYALGPDRILDAVARHAGSISHATARSLGVSRGRLRSMIDVFDLGEEVNAIRKRNRRRPAAFRDVPLNDRNVAVHERLLAPGYR